MLILVLRVSFKSVTSFFVASPLIVELILVIAPLFVLACSNASSATPLAVATDSGVAKESADAYAALPSFKAVAKSSLEIEAFLVASTSNATPATSTLSITLTSAFSSIVANLASCALVNPFKPEISLVFLLTLGTISLSSLLWSLTVVWIPLTWSERVPTLWFNVVIWLESPSIVVGLGSYQAIS